LDAINFINKNQDKEINSNYYERKEKIYFQLKKLIEEKIKITNFKMVQMNQDLSKLLLLIQHRININSKNDKSLQNINKNIIQNINCTNTASTSEEYKSNFFKGLNEKVNNKTNENLTISNKEGEESMSKSLSAKSSKQHDVQSSINLKNEGIQISNEIQHLDLNLKKSPENKEEINSLHAKISIFGAKRISKKITMCPHKDAKHYAKVKLNKLNKLN
jgi:hypothetical protein